MKSPFKSAKQPVLAGPEDRMTLTQHLAELRVRIIRSMLAVVLGIILMLAFYDPVLRFLLRPYNDLCAERGPDFCVAVLQSLGPLEAFSTRLSICTYGGILLALPVLLWQIWRFIVPALHAKEKKYAIPFVVSSVLPLVISAMRRSISALRLHALSPTSRPMIIAVSLNDFKYFGRSLKVCSNMTPTTNERRR